MDDDRITLGEKYLREFMLCDLLDKPLQHLLHFLHIIVVSIVNLI
jgi:hypothetical protein